MTRAHDDPSDVESFDGHILVDGPGGVALTLTPAAAVAIGERLLEHAAIAVEQPTTGKGSLA